MPFYRIYFFVSLLLWPFLSLLLLWRIVKGKEDPIRYKEKKGQTTKKRDENTDQLIWIHAASVGESLSMLVLIDALLAQDKNRQILLTSGTVTSAELLAKRLPKNERVIHQYAPLDYPLWVNRFLNYWRPDMVLWAESELWPNSLYNIKKRSIPLILVNGRMSPRSFKKWQRLRPMIRFLLALFDHILVQSAEDSYHFEMLSTPNSVPITISDNLKFSAAPLPHDAAALKTMRQRQGKRPLWVFSSTHKGEEDICLSIHKKLQKTYPDLLTILIPRHPNRRKEIESLLETSGLKYAFRSDEAEKETAILPQLYVADTLGELGLFYRLANIVVMGGSFVPIGGHNPIEPAQLDCCIVTGSHIFNFQQTYADLHKWKGVLIATDPENLVEILENLFARPEKRDEMAKNALALTQHKNQHTIGLVLNAIGMSLNNANINPTSKAA